MKRLHLYVQTLCNENRIQEFVESIIASKPVGIYTEGFGEPPDE